MGSRANAYWYLCIPFASIIVSPICGWILTVANWRVMFLAEGLPAIIFAAVWWRFIDDDPTQAKWLSGSEKAYLVDTLSAERAAIREPSEAAGGNRSSRVWILVAVFFLIQVGFYGYSLWLPTLIKSISASSDLTVGFISALPWVAGAVGSIAMARYADRTGERRKCVVVATIGGATFLSLSVLLGREHPILAIAAMVFCMGFLFSYIGVFWSIPSTFLTGLGLSTGLGTINALGNLGGFIGPSVVGYLITTTHQFLAGISFLAATLVGAGVLMSLLPVPSRQPDQLSRGHS